MTLPTDFIRQTGDMLGRETSEKLFSALQEEATVSLRLNPWARAVADEQVLSSYERVAWCPDGYYLKSRPPFTFDPLLHCGAYYVQEASSMFLSHVLRSLVPDPVMMLDLCAAPGGKSTCALSALAEGSVLFCNEPVAPRAQVLAENIQKWHLPQLANHQSPITTHHSQLITNATAADYARSGLMFDVILTDVPCSGEGMFRKDEGAAAEWSLANVDRCQSLQRDIVGTVWPCLKPGGLLIYSTCTFNTLENETNTAWIASELGATTVEVSTDSSWNITGWMLPGQPLAAYRFLPGFTRGEGLYMTVLRKNGTCTDTTSPAERLGYFLRQHKRLLAKGKAPNMMPTDFLDAMREAADAPRAELSWQQAVAYLRREAITLPPDTPRGTVCLTYKHLPIGLAKNLGTRANNLYPKPWRIKSTYIPEQETLHIIA